MKRIALLPLVAALAATGACARSSDAANAQAGGNTTSVGAKPVEQPASKRAGDAMAAAQSVELIGNGLTTGSRGLHHSNIVEFGQPRATVIASIAAALGKPTATGSNADCPSGPVDYASFGPLDLHFEDDRFAGWVIDEAGGPEIESRNGLSFGDRRSELDGDAKVETVRDSTLGHELSVDGVGVLMSGPGPSDRVENLFAGVTCFAR